MAWFTKIPPAGIELERLVLAAHEVGHLLTFRAVGIAVLACGIDDNGDNGYTDVEDPADDQFHDFLVGVMAGTAAEKLWCSIHGQDLPRHCRNGESFADDRAVFRDWKRQHRRLRAPSQRKAERLARDIIRENTKRFRALTEQLAVDGELDV